MESNQSPYTRKRKHKLLQYFDIMHIIPYYLFILTS